MKKENEKIIAMDKKLINTLENRIAKKQNEINILEHQIQLLKTDIKETEETK